ncbi:hypothetical protein Tco_1407783 [Tanacetum coccineum]
MYKKRGAGGSGMRLLLNPKRTFWVLLKTTRTLWCGGCGGGQRGGEDGEGSGVGCWSDSRGGVVTVVMMKRVAGCGWRRKWWRCGGEMVADEMVMDIRWWCDVDGGVVVAAVVVFVE